MATVNDIGTNFDLPNYHGRVHQLTPSDTVFYSMLQAAATGGGQIAPARTFEWQTYDLRDADQNTVVDAKAAKDAENRSRGNVFNVLQTHLETVGVGYERMAQTGQFDGQNIAGGNPIMAEQPWQITQMWKQIARDLEFSLIRGEYDLPSTNADAAQTRGILAATSTNVVSAAGAEQDTSATSADNDFTTTGHGFETGDTVKLGGDTAPSGLSLDEAYFVIRIDADDFQLAETHADALAGDALEFSDSGTDVTVKYLKPLDDYLFESAAQLAWDEGGLQEGDSRITLIPSIHKRQIGDVIRQRGIEVRTRSVLGVNVTTVETSFGDFNFALARHMPKGTVQAVSLEQCDLHFRFVPGKGVMFAEPLAKDGARDKTQLYASCGLEYGNELAHAKVTDLSLTPPTAS